MIYTIFHVVPSDRAGARRPQQVSTNRDGENGAVGSPARPPRRSVETSPVRAAAGASTRSATGGSAATCSSRARRCGRSATTSSGSSSGSADEIELALVALACQGHLLIEDVPGVGKTVLAKALARSIGCSFKRIQFTPDLLPSDVTGVSIYNQQSASSSSGPARSSPRSCWPTRSTGPRRRPRPALLEAMEERQVTVDGVTYRLPEPVRGAGDPEPDRIRGHLPAAGVAARPLHAAPAAGLPGAAEDELDILERQRTVHPLDALEAVLEPPDGAAVPGRGAGDRGRRSGAAVHRRHHAGATSRPPEIYCSAPARERPWRCSAAPRRWRSSMAATTSCRTTSRRWPSRPSPIG